MIYNMIGGAGSGGSTIVITAPTGSAVYLTVAGQRKEANEVDGTWTFKNCKVGSYIITAAKDGKTATKNLDIRVETQMLGYLIHMSYNAIPKFTYTGEYETVGTDGDWKIRFLTSGILTFTDLGGAENGIDAFCVGGAGGASGGGALGSGASGGGGYHNTFTKNVSKNTPYEVAIGAGGTGTVFSQDGGAGGATSAFGETAAGGLGGKSYNGGWVNGDGGEATGAFGETGNEYSGALERGTGNSAENNTGTGGSGGVQSSSNVLGGNGGSGIVIIRSHREV